MGILAGNGKVVGVGVKAVASFLLPVALAVADRVFRGVAPVPHGFATGVS